MALRGKYSLSVGKLKAIGNVSLYKERVIGDDTVRLEIEKLVSLGDGLARYDGGVVFVPRTVPGDVVTGKELRCIRGRTVLEAPEIENPGTYRRVPPCRYVPVCGGCDWQHISDDGQRIWKRAILAENLQRIGKLSVSEESISIVAAGSFGYRSRLRVHRKGGVSGFFRANSHEIIGIDQCIVATAGANLAMSDLAAHSSGDGDITIIDSGKRVYRSDRDRTAEVNIANRTFTFETAGFSQSNRELLEPLGSLLRGSVRSGRLIDLYAGAGLLPFLVLSGDAVCHSVVCVEPDRRNAPYITGNLMGNDVEVTVIVDTAEQALKSGAVEPTAVDGGVTTVLLDPPRGGVSKDVRNWLLKNARNRDGSPDVIYLSCDSAALARDLGTLTKGYRLESVTLLDFFPQTSHIEALAVLRPAASKWSAP